MSKRPSFQFYPADWSANPNLKRCTFAEKGIWLEVMCLLHDQPEYGVLRWSLQEIATAVKCRVADLRSLQRKGVMKGDDQALAEPFIYVPRSGRKDGAPVTLVPTQAGPIWFSSRMVKDEYVRGMRAEGGGAPVGGKASPEASPKTPPKVGLGEPFGPRVSSSSSSDSVPDGTDAGASSERPDDLAELRALDPKTGAWRLAVKVLMARGGYPDARARPLVGKWSKAFTPAELWQASEAAWQNGTLDPVSYITAALDGIKNRADGDFDPMLQPEDWRQRRWIEEFVEGKFAWDPRRGPAPGEAGCRVAPALQREFGIEPAPPQPVRGAA